MAQLHQKKCLLTTKVTFSCYFYKILTVLILFNVFFYRRSLLRCSTQSLGDSSVWSTYLRTVMLPCIEDPSVHLVDNLECHVSEESKGTAAGELLSYLQELQKKSTSVCQPLDVGVMHPLKAKLKSAWLLEDTSRNATATDKRITTITAQLLSGVTSARTL
eukprot:jgi/Phyca11/112170/e_gw1.21.605.1